MTDWRTKTMSRIRKLVKEADPKITEEVKYKTPSNPDGVFVWSLDGMISTGETYKKHLRLSFAKGPALKKKDTKGLINSYRAILLHEEDKLNETAFKKLIRDAVALNREKKTTPKKKASKSVKSKPTKVVRGYTIKYHADSKTMWSKGKIKDGQPDGYWEWYRADGTLKRSGTFKKGEAVGKWTTYDTKGKPYKVTEK